MYEWFEYVSITQLGEMFGVTRNEMGQYLADIGWRVREGGTLSPSNQAIERGYCQATENERGIRYYIWHRVKTIKALETAGYKQAKNEAPPAKIGGPFAAEPSGEAGYKVISGDGTTAIWVLGEENARMVVAALNKEFGFSSGA